MKTSSNGQKGAVVISRVSLREVTGMGGGFLFQTRFQNLLSRMMPQCAGDHGN